MAPLDRVNPVPKPEIRTVPGVPVLTKKFAHRLPFLDSSTGVPSFVASYASFKDMIPTFANDATVRATSTVVLPEQTDTDAAVVTGPPGFTLLWNNSSSFQGA